MKIIRICQFFLFFIIAFTTRSQDISNFFESYLTEAPQKLYLHTDREYYFLGDTLWFSAYLLNGQTHAPLQKDCNLYVDFLNENGDIIKNDLLPIKDGLSNGYISFYDYNIKEGKYLIRAYTDYLKNFGDDYFFCKRIIISESKKSLGFEKTEESQKIANELNIHFFPEGGFLLANKINQVAFVATNQFGEQVEVKGKLVDDMGETKCEFASEYKGMGRFFLIPEPSEKYYVILENNPDLKYELPLIKENGAKLMLTKIIKDNLRMNIISDQTYSMQPYYIAGMHRGAGSFFIKIDGQKMANTINIKTQNLKNGINRIVLLNQNYEPLSERLVYFTKEEDLSLNIHVNKKEFNTRERITVQLEGLQSLPDSILANISVSVVDENVLNSMGIEQSIKSYLLLDSELHGPIKSPADFFINDDKLSSKEKLNLLMLTNGWSNYLWNEITDNETEITYETEFGLKLKGKVNNPFKREVVYNSIISLGVMSENETTFYEAETNPEGFYEFRNIQFYDSAMVVLKGKNAKDKDLSMIEFFKNESDFPESSSIALNLLKQNVNLPFSMFRLKYINELKLEEFYPDYKTRLLDDINVRGKKPKEKDNHFRIYANPNYSVKVDETETAASNAIEFIAGRVPGVIVNTNPANASITIRGIHSIEGKNSPLLLVDGVEVDMDYLFNISVRSIDKVEVLKGSRAAIFGSDGAYGVVAVYLKDGGIYHPEIEDLPGVIVERIKGFSVSREFYSPFYVTNTGSPVPDFRSTLYWNPKVELGNNRTELSFYACDNLSRYKIFVEGITSDGKICLGIGEFEVNERSK